MIRLLVGKYPEALIMKDKWGDIPLLYAVWCNAPAEVIEFLSESYKSYHPDYKFDWGCMIKLFCKVSVPLRIVQTLVGIQQNCFPGQCDIQDIVLELTRSDMRNIDTAISLMLGPPPRTSMEVLQYLLHASVSRRLDELAVETWRNDIDHEIEDFPKVGLLFPHHEASWVYEKLSRYESVKEACATVELALWKVKIDEYHTEHRCKRLRVCSNDDRRAECRVSCGAGIVIRNVLPFLLPILVSNR